MGLLSPVVEQAKARPWRLHTLAKVEVGILFLGEV